MSLEIDYWNRLKQPKLNTIAETLPSCTNLTYLAQEIGKRATKRVGIDGIVVTVNPNDNSLLEYVKYITLIRNQGLPETLQTLNALNEHIIEHEAPIAAASVRWGLKYEKQILNQDRPWYVPYPIVDRDNTPWDPTQLSLTHPFKRHYLEALKATGSSVGQMELKAEMRPSLQELAQNTQVIPGGVPAFTASCPTQPLYPSPVLYPAQAPCLSPNYCYYW